MSAACVALQGYLQCFAVGLLEGRVALVESPPWAVHDGARQMETVSVCSTDAAPAMSLVQLGGRPVQPATLLPIVSFMQNSPAKTGRVMGMPVPAGMGCLHLCTAGYIDTATLKQHVHTSFPIPCACWEAHMQGCKENQVFLFFASSKDRRPFCFACLCSETRTQASGKYCISCSVAFFWLCAEQGHSTVLQVFNPGRTLRTSLLQGPGGSGAFSSIPGVSESLGMLDASRVLQRDFVPPPNPPDWVPAGGGSWPSSNSAPLDAGPEERPGALMSAPFCRRPNRQPRMHAFVYKHGTASMPGCNGACAAQRGCAGCACTCPSLRPTLCSSP